MKYVLGHYRVQSEPCRILMAVLLFYLLVRLRVLAGKMVIYLLVFLLGVRLVSDRFHHLLKALEFAAVDERYG